MPDIDYDKDLRIDHDALDVECVRQPELFMRYARLAADASAQHDRLKENLEVIRAETDNKVRRAMMTSGEKIREASVEGAIASDPIVRAATVELIDKKHELDILNAATRAFQQRKDSIEQLIRLATMGYFATPSMPRDLNEEMKKRIAEKQEVSVQATTTRLKRRAGL